VIVLYNYFSRVLCYMNISYFSDVKHVEKVFILNENNSGKLGRGSCLFLICLSFIVLITSRSFPCANIFVSSLFN
jgi:hypothetical protein